MRRFSGTTITTKTSAAATYSLTHSLTHSGVWSNNNNSGAAAARVSAV